MLNIYDHICKYFMFAVADKQHGNCW